MPNSIDYLHWRGDLRFSDSPVNEVDIFILSQLSTPDYTDIVPHGFQSEPVSIQDAVKKFFDTHTDSVSELGVLQSEYVLPMLRLLPDTERFGGLRLTGYANKVITENTEQFSAVTLILPDGTRCVSFRGTDDTIIGWKEDFYLAVSDRIAAQQDALDYLESCAQSYDGELIVCGHSKGGNLAVYASSHASDEIRRRIRCIYNFDGPGFRSEFLSFPGYLAVKDRIITVMSQNSTVGTLLSPVGMGRYVHSTKNGPMAHDGFSWEVAGKCFIPENGLSEPSRLFKKSMDETLGEMDFEERKDFVDELFGLLLSTGAETITELFSMISRIRIQKIAAFIRYFHASKNVTGFIQSILGNFIENTREDSAARITAGKEELVSSIREDVDQKLDSARSEVDRKLISVREELDRKLDRVFLHEKTHLPAVKPVSREVPGSFSPENSQSVIADAADTGNSSDVT